MGKTQHRSLKTHEGCLPLDKAVTAAEEMLELPFFCADSRATQSEDQFHLADLFIEPLGDLNRCVACVEKIVNRLGERIIGHR